MRPVSENVTGDEDTAFGVSVVQVVVPSGRWRRFTLVPSGLATATAAVAAVSVMLPADTDDTDGGGVVVNEAVDFVEKSLSKDASTL